MIQVNDIFYGVNWFGTDNNYIEVYRVIGINQFHTYCDIFVEPIIGEDITFRFPNNWSPDTLLTAYYCNPSIWIYSENLELIVNLNEKILNGYVPIEDISLNAWDVWNHKWFTLNPNKL